MLIYLVVKIKGQVENSRLLKGGGVGLQATPFTLVGHPFDNCGHPLGMDWENRFALTSTLTLTLTPPFWPSPTPLATPLENEATPLDRQATPLELLAILFDGHPCHTPPPWPFTIGD